MGAARAWRAARLVAGAALLAVGAVLIGWAVWQVGLGWWQASTTQVELVEDFGRAAGAEGDVGGAAEEAVGGPVDGAVALIEFRRPGAQDRPVRDDPLAVVEGTGVAELRRGPGRYDGAADPGEEGNFAVAGHRTTWGAPFWGLDELVEGDEMVVTDRDGDRHVYVVVDSQVVGPDAGWAIEPDPLGGGGSVATLTTCHPRFSDRQRLVVHAELAA